MSDILFATAGFDYNIRLWNPFTGLSRPPFFFSDSQVNKLSISPNKKYMAAAGNPQIKLFSLTANTSYPVSNFSAHKSNVTAIGFEKEGDFLYSASEDGTIKIWDPRVPNFQREFVSKEPCNTLEMHPNQNDLIAGYQNGVICVYDLCSGKKRLEMPLGSDHSVLSISIASNGTKCCAATSSGRCFHFNLDQTAEYFNNMKSWQAHDTYILKILFSPDMRLLTFPNLSMIATPSADSTVRLWHTSDFSLHKLLKGHTGWVWDCAFSSYSDYLFTASSDNMARLWNIQKEKTVVRYSKHTSAVICLALNDNSYIKDYNELLLSYSDVVE